MTQPIPDPVFVILCDDEGGGRIVVDLDAFVRYGTQMDASLADLEGKWGHLAPPRAAPRRTFESPNPSPGI